MRATEWTSRVSDISVGAIALVPFEQVEYAALMKRVPASVESDDGESTVARLEKILQTNTTLVFRLVRGC